MKTFEAVVRALVVFAIMLAVITSVSLSGFIFHFSTIIDPLVQTSIAPRMSILELLIVVSLGLMGMASIVFFGAHLHIASSMNNKRESEKSWFWIFLFIIDTVTVCTWMMLNIGKIQPQALLFCVILVLAVNVLNIVRYLYVLLFGR